MIVLEVQMDVKNDTSSVKKFREMAGSQQGFIQAALLFGIALMTAVLGGFALANRTPTSQTDVEQAKVNASVILKQGSDLRDGVQRYASDNGSAAVKETMDFSIGNAGLFNPTNRYASPQTVPKSAFSTLALATYTDIKPPSAKVAGHWYWQTQITVPGIGSDSAGGNDPMVFIPEIKKEVCEQINRQLYGVPSSLPLTTGALSDFTGTGGVTLAGTTIGNKPEGCVSYDDAGTSKYIYFKVVQEN